MFTLDITWDSLCTSPTQQTKRTECCVIGTPCSPEPRYLTLSTSPVLTTGDTLSTTTPELIVRIQVDIQILLAVIFVKWKSTVTACMNTSKKNLLVFSQLFPQKFAFGPFQLSFLKINWKKIVFSQNYKSVISCPFFKIYEMTCATVWQSLR